MVNEAKHFGVEVRPVDINRSRDRYWVEEGAIRVGLAQVLGVSAAGLKAILAARAEGGPFHSLRDFCARADLARPMVENLIKAGAFDGLRLSRRQLLWELHEICRTGARRRDRLQQRNGQLALLGAEAAETLPAALAVECVHAFSLVHDDLPAMDDDDLRRGKPSNHKVFGEGMAVLAGDGLLALAFEVLATRARSPQVAAGWVAELADATGRQGMIGGQAADILGEQEKPNAELVGRIHRSKTARLVQCACRLGAIAAGAGGEAYRSVSEYGLHAGLAFQMADDLLDETSSSGMMGKETAKDTGAGKQTYVRAVGLERARELARGEAEAAVAALAEFGEAADNLRALARFVVARDH